MDIIVEEDNPRYKEFMWEVMDIITTSIIWLLLLLSLKYYKDVIIKRQRERINMLEEVWTRKKHELQ